MIGPLRWYALLQGVAFFGLAILTDRLHAQDAVPEPLEFRRMYVPQAQLRSGPRDAGVRYAPMAKADFERLVEVLRTSPPEIKNTLAARVQAAQYRASLIGEGQLSGQAMLEIERPQSRAAKTNANDDPGALLPLEPCGLAVSNPHWPDDPPEDAVCGLDSQGQFTVLARRSGTLVFDWKLRGVREAGGGWHYAFELPLAPSSRLTLDLPESVAVRASRGVVVQTAALEGETRRWELMPGGQTRFSIELVSQDQTRQQDRGASLRQLHTYSFSPRGVELTTQLTLDVPQEPLRQLELNVEAPLRLLAVRHGETHVPWSVLDEPAAKSARIVLEFPEPLQGPGNVILLGATAPIKLEEAWRLPGIQAQGMFWQEGRATLLIQKPLTLERLSLSDCRQSSIGALPPPTTGESIGLQYFVPSATAEILLSHTKQRLQASLGTAIELSEDAIAGRVVAELNLSEGQLFSLQGAIPPRWNVDDVQSDPPGGVKDWSVDTPTPRKRVLDIRLAKALASEAPLRLLIRGHRVNVAANESLSVDELRIFDLADAVVKEHAMAVQCPEGFQLRLAGGEDLTRYDPQTLEPATAALFTKPPAGLLFRVDPKAARLALAMERLAPRYTANLRVAATATAGPLWEAYDIVCHPQNAALERVVVYFSQAREEPLRWRIDGEAEDDFGARRLSDEEMLAQCGRETGEMWELRMRRPRPGDLVLHAVRAGRFLAETPLSLAWLPGADSQEAQLQIRCGSDTPLQVRTARLRPIPNEPGANNLVRAAFRYLPAQDTAAAEPAPISLARNDQALAQSSAVAWQATMESRYEPTGFASHLATWFLETTGQAAFLLDLPRDVQVDDVWVDEDRVPARVVEQRLSIPLVAGRRHSVVALAFRTRETSLGELHRVTAPLPTTSLPVVAAEWLVWLPPGYQLSLEEGAWQEPDKRPLSVAQRLLGPLARVHGPRFDLFDAGAWRDLARSPWRDRDAQAAADRFLDLFGHAPEGEWGPMLKQVQAMLDATQQSLLLDRHALEKIGVQPELVAMRPTAETDRSRGLARLEAARIMLLVYENVLLLTTPQATAVYQDQLAPLEHSAIARVNSGRFAQTLKQAAIQRGAGPFCSADLWIPGPSAPWHGHRLGADSIDTPGWNLHRLSGPVAEAPRIAIVRQSTIDVFAWGLFLLIVAICFRHLQRPLRLLPWLAACAIAALLVSELYVPVFSAAGLAFLAALLWQVVVRPARQRSVPAPSSLAFRLSDSVHTATALLLLLICAATVCARAQEGAAPLPRARQTVHKVFIPVDESQRPAGDLYWVPEGLYTQMERKAARLALEPQGWLLERADYRGVLHWDVAQQRLLISELRLRFDLYVFDAPARVKLPLGKEGHALVPADKILIDGLELPAQWEEDGTLLCFDAAQAGPYRVEVSVRPTVSVSAGLSGFDLSVPPLPTATLELQLPRSSPTIDVATAAGGVELVEDGRRLVAQLGRTHRISVRWRDGAAPSLMRTTVDAEQLVWLKLQPGAVVADARWKFKVVEGSIRQFQLTLDPRLQLQAPLETHNPLVAQSRMVAGNPQIVHVELSQPVTDQFTLDASLRWSGISGVGNLRMPLLEAQPVRTLRRLLGVTLDPSLEYQEIAGEGQKSVPPAEFVQQWGGMESPPALAYRLTDEAPAWSLAVRSKPAKRTVDSILAVSLSAGRSAWRYDATVEIAGSCFEHRLATPNTMQVESVEVHEEGVPRLSHWSRDAEGGMTLFLSEPASGPQHIVLHGWAPLPQRGPWRLTGVRVDEAEQRSMQVRVYRQPSVTVDVRNRSGLAEQTDLQRQIESQLFESDRRYIPLGRLASLMKADGPTYSATLVVSPNQPRFECRQVTTLKREAGVWQAELECSFTVASGLVDSLRFDIPPTWQAPFVVSPAADYSVIDTGDGGRQLVVNPVSALTGESVLRVRGNLVPPMGGRLLLPAIGLTGAERLERVLIAPGQIDLQAVSWETRGLSQIDPPSDWVGSAGLAAPQAYLVVDDAFSAALQPAVRTPGQPRVALADISVCWQPEGGVQGIAAFDLEPSGNRECPLVLPAGHQLLRVLVDGVPALAMSEGPQKWRVSLGSDELPQRIEVLFSGTLSASKWGRRRLLAPTLGDLPVEQTLWTIQGPKGSALVDALVPRRVSAWRQELVRLQSMAESAKRVERLSSQESGADLVAWYEPWNRRFRDNLAALDRELILALEPDSAANARAEIRLLEEQQALFVRDVLGGNASASVPEEPQVRLVQLHQEQQPLRALFADRSTEIELHGGKTSDWPARLLGAVAVVVGLGGVLSLARSRWWPGLQRWRYLAGAALGIAWWMWLAPSILGLFLVLLVAIAALRDRAPPPREPGSAIVRLGA